MSEHITHEYDMYSVRSYVTYGHEICPNVFYTQKYDVSEQMLHTNVQTCVPNEYGIWSVRINVTYENV